MTLHDASARPAAAERSSTAHPTLGRTSEAALIPLSLSLYEVVLNDRPIGYLEAAGPIWVALSGTPYGFAVEAGQHRNLTAALRILTNP